MLGYKILATLAAASIGAVMTLTGLESGPQKGDTLQAFEPTHVTGKDAGTETCPVCKYGNLPAVQVWVNGNPNADVEKMAVNLDKRMSELNGNGLKFKSFMIFKSNELKNMEVELAQLAKLKNLKDVALAWVPPTSPALKEYRINPEAKTTVLIYKNRQVTDKFVDLKADAAGLKELDAAIQKIVK